MRDGKKVKHIPGEDKGDVMLYAISTCGWCKKTKELLKDLGVEFNYIDVDTLQGSDREEAIQKLSKHNPACSAPTIVINDSICIVGFDEERIREVLG